MRKLVLIFTLFVSCNSNDEDMITISDALPIQFWDASDSTFNEKAVRGTNHFCYCLPIQCADPRVIQFLDTADKAYKLLIEDVSGTIVHEVPFVKTSLGSGVWLYSYTFVPSSFSSPSICDTEIKLKIAEPVGTALSYAAGGSMTGWTNSNTDATHPWKIAAFKVRSAHFISDQITPSIASGQTIDITVKAENYFEELKVILSKTSGAGSQEVNFGSFSTPPQNSLNTFVQTVTADDTYDRCEIYAKLQFTDIVLKISEISIKDSYGVTNPSFVGSMSPWTNVDNFGAAWTWNVGESVTTILTTTPNDASDYLDGDFSAAPGGGVGFNMDIVAVGQLGADIQFTVTQFTGANSIIGSTSRIMTGAEESFSIACVADASAIDPTQFRISVIRNSGTQGSLEIKSANASGTTYTVPNGTFSSGSNWVNDESGRAWAISGGFVNLDWPVDDVAIDFFAFGISNEARKAVSFSAGNTVQYDFDYFVDFIGISGILAQVDFDIYFKLAGVTVHTISGSKQSFGGVESGSLSGSFIAPSDIDQVVIVVECVDTGSSGPKCEFGFDAIEISSDVVVKKSDCLDIATIHEGTMILEYTQDTDYAGIKYSGITPPVFQIRVSSRLFEQDFPEENESDELSDGSVVKLVGQTKDLWLFETDPMPFYMHKKMKLIFNHKSVEADNQFWIKENGYEIAKGNKQTKLRKGSVWLTLDDSIERNIS